MARHLPFRRSAQYYGAQAKDLGEVKSSTSGGIASVFARVIISEGGFVFGAAFNPFPFVKHIEVGDALGVERLKGSKYVESDTREAFRLVKIRLEEGRKVLFIGLPCQVAALYGVLGGDYKNLVTVDLICHGKSSTKLFVCWIRELERKIGASIVDYSFRTKKYCNWNEAKTYTHTYRLVDGRKGEVPIEENWYSRYFLGGVSFQEGCYRCPFAKVPRIGDVTLGDFWGGEKEQRLEKFVKNGMSLVSVQSYKGQALIQETRPYAEYIDVASDFALAANSGLTHVSKRPIYRSLLFLFVYLPRPIRAFCDKLLFDMVGGVGRFARRILWK